MRGQDKEHGMSYNLKKKVETQCSLIYENQQEHIFKTPSYNTIATPPTLYDNHIKGKPKQGPLDRN